MRWSKLAQAVALGAITSIVYSGCVGGGASGGGSGIDDRDEHGDGPSTATVVLADGANVVGQINFPRTPEREADVDWFRFRGIQGIVYTIQIQGFPPDPNVDEDLDLTGEGRDLLVAQILGFDGVTQQGNSTGTDGGDPYDIDPAGVEAEEGEFFLGDSRIVFAAPLTNDYYLRIAHNREDTGVGAYEVRISSSQQATIDDDDIMYQSGARFVSLTTEEDGNFFSGVVAGYIAGALEIDETVAVRVNFGAGFDPWITFPGDENPSPGLFHIHAGDPNNFVPALSDAGGGDHISILEVEFGPLPFVPYFAFETRSTDIAVDMGDGSTARVPITLTQTPTTLPNGLQGANIELTLHVADAIDGRGGDFELTDELFRRIIGFRWYADVHPHNDLDLDPFPVVSSRPFGGIYQIFETDFAMDPSSVVDDSGATPAERGTPIFDIFYDSSLKLFQVATQQYQIIGSGEENDPYSGVILNPDYASFVGDRVRVREGRPGETGPVLIDLGTLPAILPPPTVLYPFVDITVSEEPGFRAPIRQLTDSEAEDLRDAFYDERRGFYIEVSDAATGQRLARAEGDDLEISFFPAEGRCSLPPCSPEQDAAAGRTAKGTVTFASALPNGVSLQLFANGDELGVLNTPVNSADLPACGLTGDNRTLAAEYWPETYYWHAYGSDGKLYSGHVTVTADGCQMVVISPEDADE